MITKEELARSFGAMLAFSALACISIILLNGPYGHAAGIIPFYSLIAMVPVAFMGAGIALQKRFPKFGETTFIISSFLLISLFVIAILAVQSDLAFTLVLGAITGGLVVCLIKLKAPVVHLVFSGFGIVFTVCLILLFANFR